MALKTTVFVGNISSLSDTRYCAGMGVDMIGFPVDSSLPNQIPLEAFNEISNWVSGIKIVGEIVNNLPTDYSFDMIKLGNLDIIEEVNKSGLPYIFTLDATQDLGDVSSLNKYINPVYFLLEIPISMDMKQIKEIIESLQAPTLVGYDLSASNINSLIEAGASGIALLGSQEDKPGFKDYDELADVLEFLEKD
ncbi:MAG: hypothetical protein ACC656_13595 [Candidatus Heimdallarchaeota archaeon]